MAKVMRFLEALKNKTIPIKCLVWRARKHHDGTETYSLSVRVEVGKNFRGNAKIKKADLVSTLVTLPDGGSRYQYSLDFDRRNSKVFMNYLTFTEPKEALEALATAIECYIEAKYKEVSSLDIIEIPLDFDSGIDITLKDLLP